MFVINYFYSLYSSLAYVIFHPLAFIRYVLSHPSDFMLLYLQVFFLVIAFTDESLSAAFQSLAYGIAGLVKRNRRWFRRF
jgi:hypothetical protein